MKKFSRCTLILILVAVISGIAGYFYFDQTTIPMYSSTTKLYVTPGTDNEASLRARDGGLNDDFMIIFKSEVVISAAQTKAGTSENIAQYLTISSPADSNIIEITCTNPDKNTAKKYADAVASTAIKTTSIIPVEKIQILSEGTSDENAKEPDVVVNALKIMAAAVVAALCVEILVLLIMAAFRKKEEYDDELEYERKYGRFAQVNVNTIENAKAEAAVTKEQEDILNTEDETTEVEEVKEIEEIEEIKDIEEIEEVEVTEEPEKSKSSSKVFGRIRK